MLARALTLFPPLWHYSLVGGEVGIEHILCAGSGTHEPLLEHTDTSSLCGSSPGSQLKLMLAASVVSEKGLKVTPATGEGSEQFTTVLLNTVPYPGTMGLG